MADNSSLPNPNDYLFEIRKLTDKAFSLSEKCCQMEYVYPQEISNLSQSTQITEWSPPNQLLQLSKQRHSTSSVNLRTAQEESPHSLNEQTIKVLESIDDAYLIFNHDFRLIYANTRAGDLYTKPPALMIGKIIDEILPEEIIKKFYSKYQSETISTQPFRFQNMNISLNKNYEIIFYPSKLGFLVVVREYIIESEFIRLEKLNLAGQIACSLGHEIRNPLTTVRGYLQIMQQKKECANYQEQFDLMIAEIDRANLIISDFLSVAKDKPSKLKISNLSKVVKTILPLIQSDALLSGHPLNIDIQDSPDFSLDENEIRQMLLNLVRNALEATPPGSVITIKISTDDQYTTLAITNPSEKIDLLVLKKMGTPFFTTKESGTGLGLAICYRIAEKHKASIDILNNSSETTVEVKFHNK